MDALSINSIPQHKRERSAQIAQEVQIHLENQGRIKHYSVDAKRHWQHKPQLSFNRPKLKEEDVLEICTQYRGGVSVCELAAAYGASKTWIKNIIRKKSLESLH